MSESAKTQTGSHAQILKHYSLFTGKLIAIREPVWNSSEVLLRLKFSKFRLIILNKFTLTKTIIIEILNFLAPDVHARLTANIF